MSDTPEPSWRDTLPDNLKTHESLAQFKDINSLAEGYVNTKAMVGRKAYDLPKDDWKPEQWGEWHKTIGVPETPDKYGAPPEEMLTKAGLNKEVLASAQKRFHELGLTPRQVKGIMDEWYIPTSIKGSELQAQEKATKTQAEAANLDNELSRLYGDKKQAKLGLVKSFLSQYGNEELVKWADESGAGNNIGFVTSLIKAGEALLEDTSKRGGSGPGFASPKAAALQTIEDMKGDVEFMKRFTNGDKAAVKKWNDTYNAAYSAAA
jgi:hypothetical protein